LFSSKWNLIFLFSVLVTLFQGKTSHGIKWWRKHAHMTVSQWCQMILCIFFTHLEPQVTQRYNVRDSLNEEKLSKQFSTCFQKHRSHFVEIANEASSKIIQNMHVTWQFVQAQGKCDSWEIKSCQSLALVDWRKPNGSCYRKSRSLWSNVNEIYLFFCWLAQGIVRENGGHAVALHWSMRNLYGINPGEVTKHFQSSISSSSLSDYDLYIHVYTILICRYLFPGLVGSIWSWMGGWSFLHSLCSFVVRLHHSFIRGKRNAGDCR